jgi:hypothetical protein
MVSVSQVQPFDFIIVGGKFRLPKFLSPLEFFNANKMELQETPLPAV